MFVKRDRRFCFYSFLLFDVVASFQFIKLDRRHDCFIWIYCHWVSQFLCCHLDYFQIFVLTVSHSAWALKLRGWIWVLVPFHFSCVSPVANYLFHLAQVSYLSNGDERSYVTGFVRIRGGDAHQLHFIPVQFLAYSRPSVNICPLCFHFVSQLVLRLTK